MRTHYLLIGIVLYSAVQAVAQDRAGYTRMFRLYEDNDFINVEGHGTDQAYTNGTQLSFFYQKDHPSAFFLDRWMPEAGDSSINTYGWSVMQMMFTPKDLSRRVPDKDDYFYSAGLFATHSLHSSNAVKRYNIQSEVMMGVMGPPALGRQAQTLMHQVIQDQKPMGWGSQLKTDVLLNLNLTVEKQLGRYKQLLEWIGGAQYFGGTALNGVATYMLFRFGKMTPYFNGFISQYTKDTRKNRSQLYLILRPSAEFIVTNALIEGGVFTDNNEYTPEGGKKPRGPENNKLIGSIDYGFVIASGKLSFSFTQRTMTPLIKGLKHHQVGNLSLYLAW